MILLFTAIEHTLVIPDPTQHVASNGFDIIFARHPASVLGTGNNPDLLVYNREAV